MRATEIGLFIVARSALKGWKFMARIKGDLQKGAVAVQKASRKCTVAKTWTAWSNYEHTLKAGSPQKVLLLSVYPWLLHDAFLLQNAAFCPYSQVFPPTCARALMRSFYTCTCTDAFFPYVCTCTDTFLWTR